jgi:hypothetical protein
MIRLNRRDTLGLLLAAAPALLTGAAKAAADSWDGRFGPARSQMALLSK